MTRIKHIDITCILCGTVNDVRCASSSSAFGKPDLDFRPPFMIKYNIFYLVSRCDNCGYCNIDLDKKIKEAEQIIKTDSYQKQLNDTEFPTKANDFRCMAMIDENAGEIVKAGIDHLNAAWICDDTKKKGLAVQCRKSALEKFKAAVDKNMPILITGSEEKLLLVDLLRRTRQFKQAESECAAALRQSVKQKLKSLLDYELYLCRVKDDTCHSMDEGMEFKGG